MRLLFINAQNEEKLFLVVICLAQFVSCCSSQLSVLNYAWISDIHLDPKYDSHTTSSNCRIDQALHEHVRQDFAIESSNDVFPLPAFWGRYGCDSPKKLVVRCLNSAIQETLRATAEDAHQCGIKEDCLVLKPFIAVTGDLAAHYSGSLEKAARWEAIQVVTDLLLSAAKFSGKAYGEMKGSKEQEPSQIVLVIGNNDLPEDYFLEEWDPWAKNLYALWKDILSHTSEEIEATFLRGIYYAVPLESASGVVSLCLNTVWWSLAYPWKGDLPLDPAGQFEWLSRQLSQATRYGQKVMILGHIPPGASFYREKNFYPLSQWHEMYTNKSVFRRNF